MSDVLPQIKVTDNPQDGSFGTDPLQSSQSDTSNPPNVNARAKSPEGNEGNGTTPDMTNCHRNHVDGILIFLLILQLDLSLAQTSSFRISPPANPSHWERPMGPMFDATRSLSIPSRMCVSPRPHGISDHHDPQLISLNSKS